MTDPNEGIALSQAVLAINAAIGQLQRLGRSDTADTLIDAAENVSAYAALDADREHNDDWKRTQYSRKYISVMTSLSRQLTAAATSASTGDQDDAARVFGIKGLPGDVASLAISRRDAGDRVGEVSDAITLQRLLDTAIRNGDDVLAHAIVENAVCSGFVDIVNAFNAAYPNLSAAVERLWTAEHRKMSTLDVKVAWRIAALKPAFISNLQDYEIQSAAAGQTSVGQWNA
jgi:hypothetical protein